jgi:hypothetical protein
MDIQFTISDGVHTLTDCLHLEDGHALSDEEIEALKQQRLQAHVAFINAMPAAEHTVE